MSGERDELAEWGRLSARPGAPEDVSAPLGLQALGLGGERDGELYVPALARRERPAPLLLLLHGAGQHGHGLLERWLPLADARGVLLLAPDSRERTWDVLTGGFGPDVRFLDESLAFVFARYAIDPARLAIGGFSDGASYALSIGITNGDCFPQVIANSPGFMQPPGQSGRPRIYISHGLEDAILPIDHCSRLLVPLLRRAGYDVAYEEFAGGHRLTPEIIQHAADWWLGPG